MHPIPLHKLPDHTELILGVADRCGYAAWKAGNLAYGQRRFDEALSYFRIAAHLGLALGARDTGRMILEGVGVDASHVTAVAMF